MIEAERIKGIVTRTNLHFPERAKRPVTIVSPDWYKNKPDEFEFDWQYLCVAQDEVALRLRPAWFCYCTVISPFPNYAKRPHGSSSIFGYAKETSLFIKVRANGHHRPGAFEPKIRYPRVLWPWCVDAYFPTHLEEREHWSQGLEACFELIELLFLQGTKNNKKVDKSWSWHPETKEWKRGEVQTERTA